MNTELRKRLAKAADKYALGMFDETASRTGFIHGAEHGYKEAIAQVRKWLDEHGKLDKLDLVEFDMEMNKLWDGE